MQSTQEYGCLFEKNSAIISEDQDKRLAAWIKMLNQQYPRHALLRMGVNIEKGEKGGEALGWQREHAVRRELIRLGFTAAEVVPPSQVYVMDMTKAPSRIPEDLKRVELEFTPGCPHGCGGCPPP